MRVEHRDARNGSQMCWARDESGVPAQGASPRPMRVGAAQLALACGCMAKRQPHAHSLNPSLHASVASDEVLVDSHTLNRDLSSSEAGDTVCLLITASQSTGAPGRALSCATLLSRAQNEPKSRRLRIITKRTAPKRTAVSFSCQYCIRSTVQGPCKSRVCESVSQMDELVNA
jgi:hypothetical protein